MGANNKPKVEIGLNDSVKLTLLKEALVGENSYGPYFMYTVKEVAVDKVLFATADVHKQILEAGLKTGDVFQLTKVPGKNGKKVTARVEFEVMSRKNDDATTGVADDGFKDLMGRCVREAVEIVRSVEGYPFTQESVVSLSCTLFIQRARG